MESLKPIAGPGTPLGTSTDVLRAQGMSATATAFRIYESGFRFLLVVEWSRSIVDGSEDQLCREILLSPEVGSGDAMRLTVTGADNALDVTPIGGRAWHTTAPSFLQEADLWVPTPEPRQTVEVALRVVRPLRAAGAATIDLSV